MHEKIKERLSRLSYFEEKLAEINEQIADAEYSRYCVNGIDYQKDRVQTSPNNDSMASYVIRAEQLFKIRKHIETNMAKCIDDINKLANLVDDTKSSIIVEKYIFHKTLTEIAKDRNLTYEWVSRLFNKALEEIEKRC